MKIIKINKYDIVIYSCLLSAIGCLFIGGKEYFISLGQKSTVKEELKEAFEEIKGNKEVKEISKQDEPEKLKEYDKKIIIHEYLEEILSKIKVDDVLSYEIVRTWNEYEVSGINFVRRVADGYYEYEVEMKFSDDVNLPIGVKVQELEHQKIIKFTAYILENADEETYSIKKVEL